MSNKGEHIKESDWKYLRKSAPVMLERAFEAINKESVSLLENKKDLSQKDLYWAVSEHMEEKLKDVELCFDDHRRSTAMFKIAALRNNKFFTDDEFAGFSEETREKVESILSVRRS